MWQKPLNNRKKNTIKLVIHVDGDTVYLICANNKKDVEYMTGIVKEECGKYYLEISIEKV